MAFDPSRRALGSILLFCLIGAASWWANDLFLYSSARIHVWSLYAWALAQLSVGVLIVRATQPRWAAILLVGAGLIVGQIELLKFWFTMLTWSISGFAP